MVDKESDVEGNRTVLYIITVSVDRGEGAKHTTWANTEIKSEKQVKNT